MSDGKVVAFVLAIGRGKSRAPVVPQAIARLADVGVIDRVVVAAPAGESEMDISGGAASVRAMPSLSAALAELDTAVRVVLVCDPTRTSVSDTTVRSVVAEVVTRGVPVVPVLPCSDTVKRLDADGFVIDTPDRGGLRVVQSPVGYPADALRSGAVTLETVPVGAHVVAGDPA